MHNQLSTDEVYKAFEQSLLSDASMRTAAEATIKQMRDYPNFLSMLLQAIACPSAAASIQQAIAVYFKNWICKQWEPLEGKSLISDHDKETVKNNILHAMTFTSTFSVKALLADSFLQIVRADYPSKYQGLNHSLLELLRAQDPNAVETAIIALYKVLSFKGYDEMTAYEELLQSSFPILHGIASNCLSSSDSRAFSILKSILKCFATVIFYELPKYISNPSIFIGWFEIFMKAFSIPEPSAVSNLEAEDRAVHLYWKMRKWTLHIFFRLLSRYANLSMDPSCITEFSKYFVVNYVPGLTNAIIRMILDHSKLDYGLDGIKNASMPFLPDRIKCLLCDCLTPCIKSKITWPLLKPSVSSIIQGFLFPYCCFSDQDNELWHDDPQQYVHSKLDPYNDYYSPFAAVTTLFVELVKGRKKVVLMPTLGFLNQVLNHYLSSPTEQNARMKDGALYMVGSLEAVLMKSPIHTQMEQFIVTHVLPDLKSSFPFLRARACWMLQNFECIEYSTVSILDVFHHVLECLQHQDLPVKIEAAMAIGSLIENTQVNAAMVAYLPNVMQILLQLTNESEFDNLSFVMEKLADTYPTELAPLSVQLAVQLRETLMRLLAGMKENPEDSDKVMTAMGIFQTISTLSMSLKEAQLTELLEQMVPLFGAVLENEIVDVFDEVFELFEQLTFSLKAIPSSCWSLFPLFFKAYKAFPLDYMDEIACCFDNFISFGRSFLCLHKEYFEILLDIIRNTFTLDSFTEQDVVSACKLMESLTLNCRGFIDGFIQTFVQLCLNKLLQKDIRLVNRVYLLEGIINCILYNPSLSFQIIQLENATEFFFNLWISNGENFSRVHDKKLCIMTLKEILAIPFEQLPAPVAVFYDKLALLFAFMVTSLPKAIEERKKLEEEAEEYEDEEIYSSDEEAEEEEEESLDYNEQNVLQNLQSLQEFKVVSDGSRALATDEEDDDEEGFYEEELEEELCFSTPLDNVDIKYEVMNFLRMLQESNGSGYQRFVNGLGSQNHAVMLQSLQ